MMDAVGLDGPISVGIFITKELEVGFITTYTKNSNVRLKIFSPNILVITQ